MKNKYVKPCSDCKLFSMYVLDDCFIWYGNLLTKYKCDECGNEETE